jgi:hypothetical protein
MLISKRLTLKPLMESSEGVHLTAYLVNRGQLSHLRTQLRQTIDQTYEWLKPIMTTEEIHRFLEPIDGLLIDSSILRKMKGNVGIFRNEGSFRVLNIPVEVEQTCQVATSFHVKPLLKWLQVDQDFLLLGFERQAAHLYLGSQDSLRLVDSVLFPDSVKSPDDLGDYASLNDTFSWMNDWIAELTRATKPKLFLAGEGALVEQMLKKLAYKQTVRTAVAQRFGKQSLGEICSTIRRILRTDSKQSIESALLEFRIAEEENRARKNIFQISKAVVQGKVRKLIVTDDLNIFGKIDKKSGGISIHPFDQDHEDDDILDDLAQMVLNQGGEVIVAARGDIPKGRPILAILDKENQELEKNKELEQYEILQERFG